jgi:hypothetical protein
VCLYEDFAATKDTALVLGTVGDGLLSKEEGARFVRLVLDTYDGENFQFVESFNERPHEFDFNQWIEKCP